jgi:molecular chaperone DnaK
MTLTRGKLEELCMDLVEKTLEHCEAALRDAGLGVDEVDEVIMVGGMTKMPIILEKTSQFFKTELNREVNPDEAVAIGAAIQAGILGGDMEDVLLLDVIPLSLGIETQGSVFTKLIEKNRTIPTSCSEIFTTAEDYQPLVNIHVLQGERPMARDNKSMARFELVGIPPARRGVPKIEVTFDVDVNGILSVSARDLGTGNEQNIRVRPSSGLNEREIERLISEADAHKQTDSDKREVASLRNKADGLIYTTERSLSEFINYLTDEEIREVHADLDRCKRSIEGDDRSAILSAIKNLEKSSYKIAEVMYKDVS